MTRTVQFLWTKKKYWLIPVTVVLLLIAILIVFVGSTALSPFIYTLLKMKSHSTVLAIVLVFYL